MKDGNDYIHTSVCLIAFKGFPQTACLIVFHCVGYVMKFCFVFTALLSVTTVNYLLSLVSLVMFYVYYTHSDGCTENKVFISINMLLCMAASILSILPQIQVHSCFGCVGLSLRQGNKPYGPSH